MHHRKCYDRFLLTVVILPDPTLWPWGNETCVHVVCASYLLIANAKCEVLDVCRVHRHQQGT